MKKTLTFDSQFLLNIGWLYPDLMSTYGDRGNITVLKKRCQWREITVHIQPIDFKTKTHELENIDIIFGGGAQDREQELVMKDLHSDKGHLLKDLIENNIPALFVCGAPQLMGKYYDTSDGKKIDGLGIFQMETKQSDNSNERLIGNIIATVMNPVELTGQHIIGFENHSGRTYLDKNAVPFATVNKGYGNNGHDQTEGIVYKNAIGCYFHGPLLPKNPELADFLISKALEVKYKKAITLSTLDNSLEQMAKSSLMQRFHVRV